MAGSIWGHRRALGSNSHRGVKCTRFCQDQALITMTDLDFATFDWLADKFAVLFDMYTPWNQTTGDIVTLQLQTRGRSITASDCLGLSLMWTRTRGSTTSLQIIFGLTQIPVSVYLCFGRCILISVLSSEPDARIRVPDIETLQEHMASVHHRHPLLENVWCTMDGLKFLYLQEAGSTTVENAYYNGWKCDHYISGGIFFVRMGQFQLLSVTTSPALSMTAKLQSGELSIRNWNLCTSCAGGGAP